MHHIHIYMVSLVDIVPCERRPLILNGPCLNDICFKSIFPQRIDNMYRVYAYLGCPNEHDWYYCAL